MVVDGVVYFGSDDSFLYAVDIETGRQRWRFETGGRVFSSPAVVDGAVYFGSFENYLYAVDIESSRLRWRFETGNVVASSPAVVDGVVYVGSSDGFLYAVDDQATGAVGRQYSIHDGQGVQMAPPRLVGRSSAIPRSLTGIDDPPVGHTHVLDLPRRDTWAFATPRPHTSSLEMQPCVRNGRGSLERAWPQMISSASAPLAR